jgi:hypothetical protein
VGDFLLALSVVSVLACTRKRRLSLVVPDIRALRSGSGAFCLPTVRPKRLAALCAAFHKLTIQAARSAKQDPD